MYSIRYVSGSNDAKVDAITKALYFSLYATALDSHCCINV